MCLRDSGELLVAGTRAAGVKVCPLGFDHANQSRKAFARALKLFVSLGKCVLRPGKLGFGRLDFDGKASALRVIIRNIAGQLVFRRDSCELARLHLDLEATAQLTQMTLEGVQSSRQFLGSISGSKVCQFLADVTAPTQIFLALSGRHTRGSQVLDPGGLQGGFQLNLGSVSTGIGVERLRDAPAEWSQQFEALGLNPR